MGECLQVVNKVFPASQKFYQSFQMAVEFTSEFTCFKELCPLTLTTQEQNYIESEILPVILDESDTLRVLKK